MNRGLLRFPEGGRRPGLFANRLELTASTTWTCPPDVYAVRVTCIAGGGKGGDAAPPNDWQGGGGGGGEYAQSIVSVLPGQRYTVTVGAAAAQSSFDSVVIAKPGLNGADATSGAAGAGGSGGRGGTGQRTVDGQAGTNGGASSGTYGVGGVQPMIGLPAAAEGAAGPYAGYGGSAGFDVTGGAGHAGLVILEF